MAEKEIRREVLQKMVNEMSITDVAKELGVSKQTIYNLIKRHGLEKPDRANRVVVVD